MCPIRPIAAAALCVAALATAACSSESAPADADAQISSAMTVTVTPAVRRTMARGFSVSGPASPVEEMQLGVEVSGLRVTDLHVDVGQPVERGQLLLRLDHRMLDASLAQAAAALREAEAGAELARANLTRGEDLARSQYLSAMQLDELRANRAAAEARLGTARAAHETARLQRSFADLRAPADGIISKRLVQPGQVVSAGMELLRLIRDGRLEWRAELPASQLARVQPGDAIHLRSDSGQTIEGTVRAVTPGVDAATRTGTVYADLPAGLLQAGTLQAGAYLHGRIDTGTEQAITVPDAAVVLRDGFPVVFTVDAQSQARQQRIESGSKDAGHVEVVSGLTAGTPVVVEGAGFLADGDTVRVAAAAAAASTQAATP